MKLGNLISLISYYYKESVALRIRIASEIKITSLLASKGLYIEQPPCFKD